MVRLPQWLRKNQEATFVLYHCRVSECGAASPLAGAGLATEPRSTPEVLQKLAKRFPGNPSDLSAIFPVGPMHILLLEDDIELGGAIKHALEQQSYAVTWLTDGRSGAAALPDALFDLILLDLGLPGRDGIDLLLEARRNGIRTPILIMTARDTPEARIKGLDMGADDYLVKPFHLGELAARIRSLTRRAQGLVDNRIEVGGLVLDLATTDVVFRGERITLTRREFAVLRILMERAGRIVRRESLESSVYGFDTVVDRNAIEVHVHWLRRKLSPELIHTVRGIGYMMPREPK